MGETVEKNVKYAELLSQGFKIIKWYKTKIGDEWEHLVCLKNSQYMIIHYWNSLKGAHMLWYEDKDEANTKVVELFNRVPKEHLKTFPKEDIIHTLSLINIDSSFVQ